MTVQQIPTLPMMGRGLINHDPRSRSYDVPRMAAPLKTKTWRRGQAYDQGRTSKCVPYTAKGILNTADLSAEEEYRIRAAYPVPEFYLGAKRHDQWPGENYDGTSGLGMCKYLKSIGLIREYRWMFSLEDYLHTLSHLGPIGFGTWWKSGMWNTNARGYLEVTGRNEGGHQVELFGIDVREECVIGMNTWGTNWGDRGRFKVSFDDLDKLIGEQADGHLIVR